MQVVKTMEAEGNKLLSDSLTPALIQYNISQKWNGKLPTMTGQSGIPLLNIESVTQEKK